MILYSTRVLFVCLVYSLSSFAAHSSSTYADLCREMEKDCVWMKQFIKNEEQVVFYKTIHGEMSLDRAFQRFKQLRMSQTTASDDELSEFEKERKKQKMEDELSSVFDERMRYFKRKFSSMLFLSTEVVTVYPYKFKSGTIRFKFENPRVFGSPLPQNHCFVANDTIRHVLRSCTDTGYSWHGQYETYLPETKAEQIYGVPGMYGKTGAGPKAATLVLSPAKPARTAKGLSGPEPAFFLHGIMFYDKDQMSHTVMFSKGRETDLFNRLTDLLHQVNGAIIDLPDEWTDAVEACAEPLVDIRGEVWHARNRMENCLAKDEGCPPTNQLDFEFIERTKQKLNAIPACNNLR